MLVIDKLSDALFGAFVFTAFFFPVLGMDPFDIGEASNWIYMLAGIWAFGWLIVLLVFSGRTGRWVLGFSFALVFGTFSLYQGIEALVQHPVEFFFTLAGAACGAGSGIYIMWNALTNFWAKRELV